MCDRCDCEEDIQQAHCKCGCHSNLADLKDDDEEEEVLEEIFETLEEE